MPRESTASLSVVKPQIDAGPIRPRAGTSQSVAGVFVEIVTSVAPDHFRACDKPLVEELARCVLILRQAGDQLGADGLILEGEIHPCVKLIQKQQQLAAMLSRSLRLTPQSRASKDRAATTTAGQFGGIDFSRLRP